MEKPNIGAKNRVQNETPCAHAERSLQALLSSGQLGPGERLPTEQVLANQFGVSRTTIRAALAHLAEQGRIQRSPGKRGWRVKVPAPSRASTSLIRTVAMIAPNRLPGCCQPQPTPLWLTQIAQALERQLYVRGYHVTRLYPEYCEPPKDLVPATFWTLLVLDDGCLRPEVTGLIQRFHAARVPVVVLGDGQCGLSDIHRIEPDVEQAAFDMTRWLIGQGHRRILPCWIMNQVPPRSQQRRMKGYQTAMLDAGLPALPATVVRLLLPVLDGPVGERIAARLVAGHLAGVLHASDGLDAVLVECDCAAAIIRTALKLTGLDHDRLTIASLGRVDTCPARRGEKFPALSMDLQFQQTLDLLVELAIKPPLKPVHQRIIPKLCCPVSALSER